MKIFRFSLILFFVFFGVSFSSAVFAQVFEDNFDSYSSGDLSDQSSWDDWLQGGVNVFTDVSYDGSNSIGGDAAIQRVQRDFGSTVDSGVLSFAGFLNSSSDELSFAVKNISGNTDVCSVLYNNSGILFHNGTLNAWDEVQLNKWTYFTIDWDFNADSCHYQAVTYNSLGGQITISTTTESVVNSANSPTGVSVNFTGGDGARVDSIIADYPGLDIFEDYDGVLLREDRGQFSKVCVADENIACTIPIYYEPVQIGHTLALYRSDNYVLGQEVDTVLLQDTSSFTSALFALSTSTPQTIEYTVLDLNNFKVYYVDVHYVDFTETLSEFDSFFGDDPCANVSTSTSAFLGALECAGRRIFYWAFVPATSTLQYVQDSYTDLQGDFPFNFYFGVKDQVSNYASSTASTTAPVVLNFTSLTGGFLDIGSISMDFDAFGIWGFIYSYLVLAVYVLGFGYFTFRIIHMSHK